MRYAPSYRPIAIADRDADRTRKFSFAPVARVPHPQARPPDYLPASYPCVRTARFASFVALVGREPIRSSYEWKAGKERMKDKLRRKNPPLLRRRRQESDVRAQKSRGSGHKVRCNFGRSRCNPSNFSILQQSGLKADARFWRLRRQRGRINYVHHALQNRDDDSLMNIESLF